MRVPVCTYRGSRRCFNDVVVEKEYLSMKAVYMPDPVRFLRMTTDEIRDSFLIDLFSEPDQVTLIYSDVDRAVIGSLMPVKRPLSLPDARELASSYFAERRELGILNIGGEGLIRVDGAEHAVGNKDCLYIGRGSKDIEFTSKEASNPAKYYLLSFPAHKDYPTVLVRKADANMLQLGSMEAANKRTIYQMIHPAIMPTCQLVMGYTELEPGCVWNTMPPHTHARRMEVYLYFGMDAGSRVFHLMGPPESTRHIVVADGQAVLSPSWSIHSGVGTGAYTFCWGMGGENQEFDDMDGIDIGELR